MFARKVNVFIIRTAIVGLINIVTLYFTSHYMGPEPLGLIGFATSFIQMFFMFSELGFGSAHIKRVSEGKDISKCISTYFIIKVSIIVILLVVIVGSLVIKKHFFHSVFKHPDQERVIYYLLIPVILVQLSLVAINTFEAKKESIKSSLPLIIGPLVKAPVTIVVAVMGLGVYGLVFSRYINGIVIVALSFYLLKFHIKWPDKEYFKSYFNFAYKSFFITILVQFSLQIDKLMIGAYVSTEAVGFYFSVQSIIAVLAVIPNAVGGLLFPTISEQSARGDIDNIKLYTLLSEKYITMVLLPVTVILVFFSDTIILLLLGDKFIAASLPLKLLSVYFLINGTRKPMASVLAGTDKMGLLARLSIISVSTNIILNLILIPGKLLGIPMVGLGMNGAAIATLISGILYSVLCRIYVFKLVGIRSGKRINILFFAGFVMLVFFVVSNTFFEIGLFEKWTKLVLLAVYSLIGVLIYLGVLVIFKEFTKKEFYLILESINPGKMKAYFDSELKDKDE